ncbi:membrane dipeptidase [Nitratireductor sp. B36]|uniref:dipeptidase n=1 Tax=Nitratireductor sp. B36 TaxID=2762059 RepID=UPI001E3330F3|nr:dipeptidase [Nitratireductor sp. B36]MCC5777533.1 membrane dipeptidase [Nitratireductor sp. B36]
MADTIPVFDGHNDALLRLYQSGRRDAEQLFLEGTDRGHIDLPRAQKGGLAGGLFAIFPPPLSNMKVDGKRPQDVTFPTLGQGDALASTIAMAALLQRLERASDGRFAVCRNAAAIRAAMASDTLAAVFHIEGAEAVGPDLDLIDVLYAAGLRSLGPVWSRSNIFGHGVPFRFPSTPDIGEGLSDAGKALIRKCNRLGILVDLSHLNEKGFRDVQAISDAPLVASHSNVHAICPQSRNLTDWQMRAIRETGGLAGLNFSVSFLRPDGDTNANTDLDILLRHLDAMLEALGEDGVALGSDFDGALVPRAIGDVSGLPNLIEAMRGHGYGEELVEKIAWRNWLRVLEHTIG